MSILRCSCSAPATHQVVIEVVPRGVTADREPGHPADVRWGCYAHNHIPTMAQMQREYRKVDLDVVSYEIKELWQAAR